VTDTIQRKSTWARRGALLAARFGLAVLPVWWISRNLDWSDVVRRIGDASSVLLVCTVLSPALSLAVGAFRWGALLRVYGAVTTPPWATLFRYNLVGAWFNLLPGAVAGDALRGWRGRSVLPGAADTYAVVLVERVLGLVALLTLAGAALVSPAAKQSSVVVHVLGVALVLAAALSFALLLAPPILRALPTPSRGQLAQLAAAINRLPQPQTYGGVGKAFGLSLVTQGVVILQVLVLIWHFSPQADLISAAAIVPTLLLATYIPITPGGIGQREFLSVTFLEFAFVEAEAAVTVSILVFASTMLMAIAGGVAYAAEGFLGVTNQANESDQ